MKILTATLVVLMSSLAFGGETSTQGYLSCQSAANQGTIYFSSTWDGATNNDESAFIQFLNTKYGYKGAASCSIAYKGYNTTIARLQQSYNATVAQWRSNGKKVVETGWTNHGAPALTTNAPSGQTATAAAPKTPVPDPDDQPMPAKKVAPAPAPAHSAVAPEAETYAFCYSTGRPYHGTTQAHYYVTSIFTASTPHSDGPFSLYLRKQHPGENNQAQCVSPGPLSTVENSRRVYIENERKSFPDRDVVELNWKPAI